MKRGPWKHWVKKLEIGGKWWVFPAIWFVVFVISGVLSGMPEVKRIPAVERVLIMISAGAFFFALVPTIIVIREKLAPKVRAKYTEKRHMRNYFGGANIYLKTIGWSLFAISFAVIPFASISIALQEGPWWVSLIGLAIYAPILYLFFKKGGLWKLWRDVFSRQTTLVGHVRRSWVREFTVGGEGGTGTAQEFRLNVEGQGFKVDEEFLNWLKKDDEVIVHYWPHSKTVSRIEKLTAQDLARVLAAVEPSVTEPLPMRSYEQHLRLGIAHCKEAEWERAEAELKAALNLRSDSAEAHAWLGMAYHELGEYDEAIDHLTSAIEIEPHNEEFLTWLAYAYPDSSSFPEHLNRIRSLLGQSRRSSEAYQPLYLVYWLCCVHRGDIATALESIEQYLSEPKAKGKRHVRKLLTALRKGKGEFTDVWEIEKPW